MIQLSTLIRKVLAEKGMLTARQLSELNLPVSSTRGALTHLAKKNLIANSDEKIETPFGIYMKRDYTRKWRLTDEGRQRM